MSWKPYLESPPPYGVLVEFRQPPILDVRESRWTGFKEDLHPAMNAANLQWRYPDAEDLERLYNLET